MDVLKAGSERRTLHLDNKWLLASLGRGCGRGCRGTGAGAEAVALEEEAETFCERVTGRFAGVGRFGAGPGRVDRANVELLSVRRPFNFRFGGMFRRWWVFRGRRSYPALLAAE